MRKRRHHELKWLSKITLSHHFHSYLDLLAWNGGLFLGRLGKRFFLLDYTVGSAGRGKHRDSQDTSQDIRSFLLLLHLMVRVAKMSFWALDHRLVLSVWKQGAFQTNPARQGVALSLVLLTLMPFLFSFKAEFLHQDLEDLRELQSTLASLLLLHWGIPLWQAR